MIYPAQWATAVRGVWGGQSGWRHLLALMNEAIRLSSAFSPLALSHHPEPLPLPSSCHKQWPLRVPAKQGGSAAALLGLSNH